MSLGRALLQHSMESPTSPVSEATRQRVVTALTAAGWRGQLPNKQPPPTSSSDEQLWTALLKDDGKAFAELWRRLAGPLSGFSARQLPPSEAETVTGEVFSGVFQQGEGWLDPRATRSRGVTVRERLFRTARGLVLRRQARLLTRELDEAALQALPAKDPDGPLRQVLGRETVEQIAASAAVACQVIEQEVIAMVADGRPADEVASALGLSAGHSRAVKHRALAKLRAELRAARKRRA